MRTRPLLGVTLASLIFSGCRSCSVQHPNFEDIGETGISVSPYDLTKIIEDEDGVKLLSNRLDIQFQDGTSTEDMQKALDGIGGTLIAYNEPLEFYAVEISPTDVTGIKSSLQTLASESEVKYAEPIFVQQSTTSHTDNDDLYSDGGIMWAYEKIQLSEAHELAKNKMVNDVIVAVIDSGLTSAYTVVNVDDTEINLNSRTQYWYNFVDATTDVTDRNNDDNYGHGTKVAGIIAAKNGTGGINGVAYDAQVLPLNVFGNDEAGSTAVVQSAFADAVAYAATNPINADILNISLAFDEEAMASWYNYLNVFGDPDLIPKMEAAIEYAHDQGVIIIAAAGNDGTDSSQMFPARHQNVISVGATNDSDERADFSNYSEDSNIDYLGLAAPGEYVVTVDLNNNISIPTPEQYFSGTSASVPLVSGLVALVLSVDDDYSHDEMFNLLRGNADIISISYPDNSSHNWFRINAYQTLADVLDETISEDDTGNTEEESGTILDTISTDVGVGRDFGIGENYIWQADNSCSCLYKISFDGTIENVTTFDYVYATEYATGSVWQLTDRELYELSNSGSVLNSYSLGYSEIGIYQFGITGLVYDGERFWLAANEVIYNGDRAMFTLDPLTEQVEEEFKLDNIGSIGGLAWDGEALWLADWEANIIYKLDTNGDILDRMTLSSIEEPWGLAFDDDGKLWVSELHDGTFYQIQP